MTSSSVFSVFTSSRFYFITLYLGNFSTQKLMQKGVSFKSFLCIETQVQGCDFKEMQSRLIIDKVICSWNWYLAYYVHGFHVIYTKFVTKSVTDCLKRLISKSILYNKNIWHILTHGSTREYLGWKVVVS
jgi:hypothetical protein